MPIAANPFKSDSIRLFVAVSDGLDDLLKAWGEVLRNDGVIPDQRSWTDARKLLVSVAAETRPANLNQYRQLLSPLLCSSESQQNAFNECFNIWAQNQALLEADIIASPGAASERMARKKREVAAERSNSRRRLIVIMVILGLIAAGWYGMYRAQEVATEIKRKEIFETNAESVTRAIPLPAPAEGQAQPLVLSRPPYPNVIEVPAVAERKLLMRRLLGWVLPLAGLALLMAWLWFQHRVALEIAKGLADRVTRPLRIALGKLARRLFIRTGHDSQRLGALRHSIAPGSQLDASRSARLTAEKLGMPSLVWKVRRPLTEWLVVVQSQGRNDQSGAYGEELSRELNRCGVNSRWYSFIKTPVKLYRQGRLDRPVASLEALRGRFTESRLIIVCSPESLVGKDGPETWARYLLLWQAPILVFYRSPTPREANGIEGLGLPYLRLGDERLSSLLISFLEGDIPKSSASGLQSLLPQSIAHSDLWVVDKPRQSRGALDQWYQTLTYWLGKDGMLLLSAMAVYPQLNWSLTRLLWSRLFQQTRDAAPTPEVLVRVVRLPGSQNGRLPHWLRKRLINALDTGQERLIREIYRDLFGRQRSAPGNEAIDMNLVSPGQKDIRKIKDQLSSLSPNAPINDALYTKVVFGHSRVTDFILPKWIEQLIPPDYRYWVRKLVLPTLGLLVATIGANLWWHQYEEARWLQRQNNTLAAGASMVIRHTPPFAGVAAALSGDLQKYGWETALTQIDPEPNGSNPPSSRLRAPEALSVQALKLLEYHLWGNAAILEPLDQGAPVITLAGLQAGMVFSDQLQGVGDANITIREITLNNSVRFEMVTIQAGKFLMGSDQDEEGRDGDEGPVHPVDIPTFEIGRNEVTWAEWELCEQDKACEVLDRPSWIAGQDSTSGSVSGNPLSHPVVNVSWDQIGQYIDWLKGVTGDDYRLPSESEWEYVARAGSETRYWWGDQASHEWANYEGVEGGDTWEFTSPTGSFPANSYGVYDTAGNVWEWLEDCWHRDYTNAPADGSAWLESEKGDCGLRVLRGGSWYITPGLLRSANRDWHPADVANGVVGFRLARTLQ